MIYYNYTLIISTNGKSSEDYKNEMIKYFKDNEMKDADVSLFSLDIEYDDGSKSSIWTRDFLHDWLNNKLSLCKCTYISKDFVNVHITHDMSIYFWTCYTLNRLRYNIDEVLTMFKQNINKSITCWDFSCMWESNFHTTKFFEDNNNKNKKNILINYVKDFKLANAELIDIIISENTIQIAFLYKDYYLFFLIEKKNLKIEVKYYFSDDDLWYHFFLRDKNNITTKIWRKDKTNILGFLNMLFKLNIVFRKILLNN